MESFTVSIADVPIRAVSRFPGAAAPYRDYLSAAAPAFTVAATEERLEKERADLARMAEKYPRMFGRVNEEELDGLCVYHQIAEGLIAYGALVFHGSAVAVDGQAYLFTAPSGTGKSTHTRLWRELFGRRAVMVNDDRPVLKFQRDGGVLVYGSPWMGKARLGANIHAPLKAVCILTRGPVNDIRGVSGQEAYPILLKQSYQAGTEAYRRRLLALLDRLVQTTRLYRLECNMDREAAAVAYRGMQEV